MSATMTAAPAVGAPTLPRDRGRAGSIGAYCRRNPQLVAGLAIVLALLLLLLLIGPIGSLFVNVKSAEPLSELPGLAPSWEAPLGSDDQGRNLAAVMVAGLPLTLRVGFLAGAIGLAIGVLLGFLAGFLGGAVDAVIRMAVDTLLTVPALLVLIIIAASIRGVVSVTVMAITVATLVIDLTYPLLDPRISYQRAR